MKVFLIPIISILITLFPSLIKGQDSEKEGRIDSLRKELISVQEDTNKVKIIMDLFDLGGFKDTLELSRYLSNALQISKNKDYLLGIAFINEYYGDFYSYFNYYTKATSYYENSKKIFKQCLQKRIFEKNLIKIAANYFNISRINLKLGMDDSAAIYLEKALNEISISKENNNIAAGYCYTTGNLYGMKNLPNLALVYHKQGLNILLNNCKDSLLLLSQFYRIIAIDYSALNIPDSATYYSGLETKILKNNGDENDPEKLIDKGLDYYLNRHDTINARKYFQKALKILEKDKNSMGFQKAQCYTFLGDLLFNSVTSINLNETNISKALSNYYAARDLLLDELNNGSFNNLLADSISLSEYQNLLVQNDKNIGIILFQKNDTNARKYLKDAITILNNQSNIYAKQVMLGCFYYLSDSYAVSKEYDNSIMILDRSLMISDSLLKSTKDTASYYGAMGVSCYYLGYYNFLLFGDMVNLSENEYMQNNDSFINSKNQNYINLSSRYFEYAHSILEQRKDTMYMPKIYYYLGKIYNALKNDTLALAYFYNATELLKKSNSDYDPEIGYIPYIIGYSYQMIGALLKNLGYVPQSIEYANKSIDQYEKLILLAEKKDKKVYIPDETLLRSSILSVYDFLVFTYMEIGDYNNSINYAKKELEAFKNTSNNNEHLDEINYLKTNIEIANFYINNTFQEWVKSDNPELPALTSYYVNKIRQEKDTFNLITYYSFLFILDIIQFNFDTIQTVINSYSPIVQKYKNKLNSSTFNTVDLLYTFAGIFEITGDFETAEKFIQNAFYICAPSDTTNSIKLNIKYGDICQALNEYQNSEYYYDNANVLLNKFCFPFSEDKYSVYDCNGQLLTTKIHLASNYINLGKYDEALYIYHEIIRRNEQDSIIINMGKPCFIYDKMGELFTKAGYPDSAIFYYDKVKNCQDIDTANMVLTVSRNIDYKKVSSKDTINLFKEWQDIAEEFLRNYITTSISIASNFIDLRKYDEADAILNEALEEYYILFPDSISRKHDDKNYYANIITSKGYIYEQQKEYLKALTFYQRVLCERFDITDTSIYFKPSRLDFFTKNTEDINLSIGILALKALCFFSLYENESHTSQDLSMSLENYKLTNRLIDTVRNRYSDKDYKLLITGNYSDLLKEAIPVAIAANDPASAFTFAEKSKAQLLLFSLMESKAKHFNIPDSAVSKENDLKSTYLICNNNYEQDINNKSLQSASVEAERNHKSYIKYLEKEYPNYFEMKYSSKTSSVSEIQEILDGKTAIIEYINTDTVLYAFVITKNIFKALTISKDTMDAAISTYTKIILQDKQPNIFLPQSMYLYNKLFGPIREKIPEIFSDTSFKLVIIPDDSLYLLPFETLVTDNKNSTDYSKMNYLILNHDISYHYSSTLWVESTTTVNNAKEKFAGFAPVFHDSNVTEIGNSDKIVNAIANKFNDPEGAYCYKDASKENFINSISDQKYILTITHAFYKKDAPQNSGILFSGTNNTTDILLSGEMYNLKINADLVFLAACETGVGKIFKGEGLMANTRGFLYNGTPNVIYSLWQIPPEPTLILVNDFFTYMIDGYSYSRSLRNAKINMIKNMVNSRPYKWSGLILLGK
jgi:CHAT domain-containing protein